MATRFFISAKKDRQLEVDAFANKLKAHGWERTLAWKHEDGANHKENSEIALAELQGVHEADVLIALLPGGFGTHVEIGAALALGKPVILHAPDLKTLETPYPCVFHYHPAVKILISASPDVDAILACIQ